MFVILKAIEIEGIKIIRYESSIFYANVDNFVTRIFKLSGINPNEIIAKMNKKREEFAKKQQKLTNEKSSWSQKLPFIKSNGQDETPVENEVQTISSVRPFNFIRKKTFKIQIYQ